MKMNISGIWKDSSGETHIHLITRPPHHEMYPVRIDKSERDKLDREFNKLYYAYQEKVLQLHLGIVEIMQEK
jgi:hypothetical protein